MYTQTEHAVFNNIFTTHQITSYQENAFSDDVSMNAPTLVTPRGKIQGTE